MIAKPNFDHNAISAIRVFSADAIQKAKSGHPGMPLGAAPIAWELFARHMKHNPANPQWVDRDRFILSAGHASMLLYSLLYLFGYGLTAEDLAQFRQYESRTPGHPEFGVTAGVEMSTGPLGQGVASAVGFAMAEAHLAARFNRPGHEIVDHYTYVLTGDGCLQEGVSGEAASLAGTQKLGKLIVLYDRNQITIEGSTDLAFTEDVKGRYLAYGWQVLEVEDANDLKAVSAALDLAKAEKNKPSMIICHSQIGYGSPLAGSAKTHGAPLGDDNIAALKEFVGWPKDLAMFEIPADLKEDLQALRAVLAQKEAAWNDSFNAWQKAFPELAKEWDDCFSGKLDDLKEALFKELPEKPEATRKSSGRVLNTVSRVLPNLFGGSADLAPSNNSWMDDFEAFGPEHREGRNIHFGVREFAMACCMNGINLHGGLRGYCATFFVFSDYMRGAMRMSALMNIPALYVCTHDSVGVGEDGPTHQPVEHLTALRVIPDLLVFRPADYRETAASYLYALESRRPSVFTLSRQNLPQLENSSEDISRGAYIMKDAADPKLILMGSGSEVSLLLEVQAELEAQGIGSRVVSVPCLDLFLEQDKAYQEQILPPALSKRLAVEAGSSMSWYRLVGGEGHVHGIDRFGTSAPAGKVFEALGFTKEALLQEAMALLQ